MIYLDHAATTPIDPRVKDAMLPFLCEKFGNPSSIHRAGQDARRALDDARDALAAALGAEPGEVYFTSGGTEANNMAIIGALLAARQAGVGRDEVIVATAEHHAVLDCAHWVATLGFKPVVLPVDECGRVLPEVLEAALSEKVALVSLMHANNEVGTIQPIAELSTLAHAHGALFHTDAVQTLGALPLDVNALGVDMLSVSSHKIYGPKGVGALYLRRGTRLTSLFHGGSQERQQRPGTENVAGIVGFSEAVRLLPTWRDEAAERMRGQAERFLARLSERLPGLALNGPPLGEERLPANLNLRFPSGDAETILLALDLAGVAASAGSACASGSLEPSHVLKAIGLNLTQARASVRFSLGRATTDDELAEAAELICSAAK